VNGEATHTPKPTSGTAGPKPHTTEHAKSGDCVSTGAAAVPAPAFEVADEAKLTQLEFSVSVSVRYHSKRRSWFDALARWPSVVSLVAGSAAFVSISQGMPTLATVASAATALFGGANLVFGFAERARRHDELVRKFTLLAAEIAETATPSHSELRRWMGAKYRIEADEPTPNNVLNVLCHNEESEARGYGPEHLYHVRWWQRAAVQFCALPPNHFPSATQ